MKILVLDNYDSFTYNLVYLLRELGAELTVIRNDKITLDEVAAYDKIMLSPGPGIPNEAGIMQSLIREFAPKKSILGVCLGHQGVAEVFGAELENMEEVLHGISDTLVLSDSSDNLFMGLPKEFEVGRYHSWTVVSASVPDELVVTATDKKGRIMALSHTTFDVRGVQFHPESVLTQHGKKMIENWLNA